MRGYPNSYRQKQIKKQVRIPKLISKIFWLFCSLLPRKLNPDNKTTRLPLFLPHFSSACAPVQHWLALCSVHGNNTLFATRITQFNRDWSKFRTYTLMPEQQKHEGDSKNSPLPSFEVLNPDSFNLIHIVLQYIW